MITQPHHTPEEWARFVTEDLSSHELSLYRDHLPTCQACAADLADACSELALLGVAVPPCDVTHGARARFMEKLQSAPQSNPGKLKRTLLSMKPGFSRLRSKSRVARKAG